MTPEEKDLLFKDLCARLPYNVRCLHKEDDGEDYIDTIIGFDGCRFEIEEQFYDVEDFKPYLRPMSSMTKEEINEFILISDTVLWLGNKRSTCILSLEQTDWLNKHYFDYHDLIEKGLALEAPEHMYIISSSKSDSIPIIELPKSKDNKSDDWILIRDGMYMDKDGHIIGGLKIK